MFSKIKHKSLCILVHDETIENNVPIPSPNIKIHVFEAEEEIGEDDIPDEIYRLLDHFHWLFKRLNEV